MANDVSQTEVGWVVSSKAPRATESEPPPMEGAGIWDRESDDHSGTATAAHPHTANSIRMGAESSVTKCRSPLPFRALIQNAFEDASRIGHAQQTCTTHLALTRTHGSESLEVAERIGAATGPHKAVWSADGTNPEGQPNPNRLAGGGWDLGSRKR